MQVQPSLTTIRKTLAIFWRFSLHHKFLFWFSIGGSIMASIVSDILPPLVIALTFDKLQALYAVHQPITLTAMEPYLISYLIICVAALFMWRTQVYAAWKNTILAQKDMMNQIFDHLQYMDSMFHAERFGGALVSQANKFVGAYEQFMGELNWNVLNGITIFFASLAILLYVNFIYAIVFSVCAAGYFIVIYRQTKFLLPYNMQVSSSESETTAKLADTITNMSTVHGFAGEQFESALFNQQTTATLNRRLALMKIQLRKELFSRGSLELMQILAFAAGLASITFLKVPIGALYLTITYTINLVQRLWVFMFVLRNINRQFGDAADMTQILNLYSQINDPAQPQAAQIQHGAIEFKNICFAYPKEKDKLLFDNFNLKINAGEKVGLVGVSGGGKTTLTKLLLRFMDIKSGEILIDNQNIAAITQADLRRHISYVAQEPILFHRTVAENIAYSNPNASQTEIETVAKLAHAHDFIMQLPEAYQTLVGERGGKLSGGQRQRIAIARAMLKNTPVLILDEATSALDSENEVLIQDALWRLMQGRTTIVIAHRLSTIQHMDRIIVLQNGAIAEEGSHHELLQKQGTYAALWRHQTGGFMR